MSNILPFRKNNLAVDTGPDPNEDEPLFTPHRKNGPWKVSESEQYFRTHIDETDIETGRTEQISVEELYPLRESSRSKLVIAGKLLNEALGHMREAREAYSAGDHVGADDATQRLQLLMPELFCCRALGDGFGALILAVFHGLQNTLGQPITEKQIGSINDAIYRLSKEPFIMFDSAVEVISNLEKSGLVVEPQRLSRISDILDE